MTFRYPIKGTLESVVLGFDFSAEAPSVSLHQIDCESDAGAHDATPAAVLSGDAQVDGSNPARILQRVAGGVDGTDYRIQCTVTTSAGDTLTLAAILPVRAKL